MNDLDTLSREIAATGTDWIKPGVRGVRDGGQACTVLSVRAGVGLLYYAAHNEGYTSEEDVDRFAARWRPDLTDSGTLGALLFSLKGGDVRRGAMGYYTASWVIDGDSRQPELSRSIPAFSRAEAIGRAWIAAQKEAP